MAALDPRIEEIRTRYGLSRDDFWELPQKKGTWIAKHAALEVAAAKAKIVFLAPQVLEADGAAKSVALCVTGTLDDRSEWSVGEASPANNKNAYPYAMAEKRAKDRVILKLIGLHGLIYSEDEADDFKQPANGHAAPAPVEIYEADPDGQHAAWMNLQLRQISECATMLALYQWLDKKAGNGGTLTDPVSMSNLDKLKKKNLADYSKVVQAFNNKLREINRKETV